MQIILDTERLTYFDLEIIRSIIAQLDNVVSEPEEPVAAQPAPEVERKRRGRKKADHLKVVETETPALEPEAVFGAAAEPVLQPSPAPEMSPSPTEGTPTQEDLRSALRSYSEKNGVPAAAELLKKYGASRISDLTVDRYTDFFKECGQ